MVGNNFVGTSDAMLATRFQAVAAVRNLSNVSIARTIDVSAPAVTKWLRTGRIGRVHLVEFCEAYNIDLIWMLTGKGNMRAATDNSDKLMLLPAVPLNRAKLIDEELVACHASDEAGRLPYHRQNDNLTFVIQLTDASMAPSLPLGSFLFFEKIASYSELPIGSIIAVTPEDKQEIFVRRLEEPTMGRRIFAPDNRTHPSIEGGKAQILGVCVECRYHPSQISGFNR